MTTPVDCLYKGMRRDSVTAARIPMAKDKKKRTVDFNCKDSREVKTGNNILGIGRISK